MTSCSRSIPLNVQLKAFVQGRPDIYRMVLTYEPIPFEWLRKQISKQGIACKAQELLDWLDEEVN